MSSFAFGLNGSYKKGTTTEDVNRAHGSTRTPVLPGWATSVTEGVAGQVGSLLGRNPHDYVAPSNDLQQQAASGAANLTGQWWNVDGAADLMRGVARHDAKTYAPTFGAADSYGAVTGQTAIGQAAMGRSTGAQAASLLDNLDSYMSPYRRQVVDSALADFDYSAGQTRAQQDLELAGSGAFGGSGAALTRSMTEDALSRGRATTSANLLDQMFQRGAALSADDANRRQQVSLANAAAADQFGLANMDAANRFGLANLEAVNRFGLANMDAQNQAAQFNTSARNQFGLSNMAAANEAGRFGAEAADRALQRQMDAARGLTDLASAYEGNQRANIASQAQMGGLLRDIDQQYRQAPITNTQQLVAMLGGLPMSLFAGEQTNGFENTHSRTKTKGLEVGGSATW